MAKRIVLDILFFVSLIVMPWWFSTIFVVVLLFVFESYYEAILGGFILDFIFSIPTETFLNFQFVFASLFLILFIIAKLLKKRLRFYP